MHHARLHTPLARFHTAAAVAVLLSLAALPGAHAQGMPSREVATEVRKLFLANLDSLQSKYLALAEAIPAEKFSWSPGAGVRSLGQVFMHVASEYYVYAPMAFGGARSSIIPRSREGFEQFEASATKAGAIKALTDGLAYSKQTIGALDPAAFSGTFKVFGGEHTILETSVSMTDDLHEHLGQLIAYARMVGVKPPWSK